jgi:putative transcriptional regulator
MSEHLLNNIRALRMEKGDTQERLAEVAGVSRQTIIAIEKGHYTPSLSLAMKIAAHFRKRVEEVFTLKS